MTDLKPRHSDRRAPHATAATNLSALHQAWSGFRPNPKGKSQLKDCDPQIKPPTPNRTRPVNRTARHRLLYIVAFAVTVFCATRPIASVAQADSRPNIILFLTDDQDKESIGAYGATISSNERQ